jgi:hypothetical protein
MVLLFERFQVVLIGFVAKYTSKATLKDFAGCSPKERPWILWPKWSSIFLVVIGQGRMKLAVIIYFR